MSIKKAIITLASLATSALGFASDKIQAPDFAYPQQVISQSEKQLASALKKDDGESVINALIKFGIAKTSISPDNYPEVVRKVEGIALKESNPVTKSLLNMLLTDLYSNYYSSDKYNLDRRTTVAGTDDFTLWSGEQFKAHIANLIDQSLADSQALMSARISDYPEVITGDNLTPIFYPTLFDFACSHAIKTLDSFNTVARLLPLSCIYFEGSTVIPNTMPEVNRQMITIADRWVEANRVGSPSRVEALIWRSNFIDDMVIVNSRESKFDLIMKLYRDNISTPYAIEILLNTDISESDSQRNKEYYATLSEFVKQNPDYIRINAVKASLKELSNPSVTLSTPGQVAKGVPFDIKVGVKNLSSFDIEIRKVKNSFTGDYLSKTDVEKPCLVIPVKLDGTIPFDCEISVQAVINDYGHYILTVPQLTSPDTYYNTLSCSDLVLFDNFIETDMMAWVVNPASGAPVPDTQITLSTRKRGQRQPQVINTFTTDGDGTAKIVSDYNDITLKATKESDTYGSSIGQWLDKNHVTKSTAAFIRTALPLYHPGDTAEIAIIVYEFDDKEHKAVDDKDFSLEIHNVNYEIVETLELHTDSYGRANARFSLPKDGLTGYYSASLKDGKYQISSQSFMVSDYKLPTYEVSVDSVETRADGIAIRGKALTYSGFPVADADVTLVLNVSGDRWWHFSEAVNFYKTSGKTDAEGLFEFIITTEELASSPYPKGRVTADIQVTSLSGENRSASTKFSLGKPYSIEASKNGVIMATKDSKLDIRLEDMAGNTIDDTFMLRFTRDGKQTDIEAVSKSGITIADLSSLCSGTYSLSISSLNGLADEATLYNVVVYRDGDNYSPVDAPLWILNNRLSATKGDKKVYATIATTVDDLHIFLTLNSKGRIISRKWVNPSKGVTKLPIEIPGDASSVTATLTAVYNLDVYNFSINVNVIDPSESLKVTIEHIRDKVTPGMEETVTIKVTDGAGKGRNAAVILDMYSKALDAIQTQSWRFNPASVYFPGLQSYNSLGSIYYFSASGSIGKTGNISPILMPQFNLYGKSFVAHDPWMGFGVPMLSKSKARKSHSNRASGIDKEAMVVEEAAVAGTFDADYVQSTNDEGAIITEDEEEASVDNFSYRPSEIPLALFAPDLSTDAEGNLTYSFTVPNANTTWVLNALTFNTDMLTDLAVKEIIASKPVMVEPNLPRFIRQGDKAEIRATVMNVSDSSKSIVTTFELLNPTDLSVIRSVSATSEIAANSSVTERFEIDASTDLSALIVRVKSSDGLYADGVQTLLPVLPSSQQVIDSKTFYIEPDDLSFEMAMPESKGDATTILSFCENPTWEVVSALPGLRADNGLTSLSASAAIFSAAVSGYVMDLNPAVESALKEWISGAKDNGTMLSMLNRNEDLKQLVLSSTPWVQDAADDNERLTRLSLLFDRDNISRSISGGIARLSKLQCSDGGWAWTANYMESSEWVTLAILNNFAELRQLGCYPKELDPMIKNAIKYIDKTIATDYKKYPKADYTYYTYVRSLYPEVSQSTGAAAASRATVQKLINGWKKLSTVEKAEAALILYRNDYRTLARQVLASLREFATYSPELGMWWDSVGRSSHLSLTRTGQMAFILEAFNTIEPGCQEIDRIRQWLILNKTAQEWGTSLNASACVAAILRCGNDWLHKPGNVAITVGDEAVKPSEIDSLTGSFVAKVEAAGNLSIKRAAEGPAWGAVMTKSNQIMREIAPNSLPELSISKQILVKDGSDWAETDTAKVGQVAKIRLIINASRDIDYVTIVDNRAATMEPVIQTPRPVYCDNTVFYLENRDAATNLFINRLPKGQYILEYEMNVNNAGSFSSGIATIQSQYAPELTAHSGGNFLTVK